jgi:hypothetical protein
MVSLLNVETAIGSLGTTGGSAPFSIHSITLNPTTGEVPDVVWIGGKQVLIEHQLVGGDKVIQAAGPQPDALTWTAFFFGPQAQSKARQVDALRLAGTSVYVSFNSYRYLVQVQEFVWGVADRGFRAPYRITCVVQPIAATTAASTPSALSDEVGPDLSSAVDSVTDTLAQVSTFASDAIGQAQTVAGQLTPVANLVGAGGALASVTDKLTAASALASAGTNFAAAPAAAASMISGLQSAGSSLMDTISKAGANIEGIAGAAGDGNLVADMSSLKAALANLGAQVAAVDAGAYTNRALVNTQLAAGQTPSGPVVHS